MELRNKFDREISFDNLQEAKKYFYPKTEKPCEPEEYLGDNYESYCKVFQAYKVEIKAARTLDELADVLNRYSDAFDNGTEYYIKGAEESIDRQGLSKGSKVKVHMYEDTSYSKEISTRHYDEIFEVKEQNGKLGIDWNTGRSTYICHGEVFTPFNTFASSVVFEDIETGKTYSHSNISNTLEETKLTTESEKKYELTDIYKTAPNGETLYRIRALETFTNEATNIEIRAGQLGGFVQSESNLSQDGTCWVNTNAQVYGNARINSNAFITGNTQVYGNSCIYGKAFVSGNAKIYDDTCIDGNCYIRENAVISENAHIGGYASISGNARIYGDANVTGGAIVTGNAHIFGEAYINSSSYISGEAIVCGKAQIIENTEISTGIHDGTAAPAQITMQSQSLEM